MLNKDIIIRPIRLEDNAAIASIIRDSLMEFGAARPGTVYFDDTTDHLFELFHNRNAAYFIAERKEIVVAGAGIFPTEGLADGDCELVKMYVSAEARGIGLGKIMLMKCMDTAREMGFQRMYLESMPELQTAISMYENSGFERIPGPLGNSGHTGCSVWMIKKL